MESYTMLLPLLLCSMLLVPSLTVLLFLAESMTRSIMFVLWKRFGNHFTWHTGTELIPPQHLLPAGEASPVAGRFDYLRWVCDGKQRTSRYRQGPAEEQAVRCVFCLCDIEDGEEVRELRCEHLFHKSCLDRWVGYGRGTCPLCRKSLASKVAEAELPWEEETELSVSVLMFVLHLPGAWWVR